MESDCSPESPECSCPCRCGCQNDKNGSDIPFFGMDGMKIPLGKDGLCFSCNTGDHETPPVYLERLIALHTEILEKLKVRFNSR